MVAGNDINAETEADTRANRIEPALYAAGWTKPMVKREEIAPGRILEGGRRASAMYADFVLRYKGHKLAAVEAKRSGVKTTEGVGQAKEYAKRLKTRFAYATNGLTWYEIDMVSGLSLIHISEPTRPY